MPRLVLRDYYIGGEGTEYPPKPEIVLDFKYERVSEDEADRENPWDDKVGDPYAPSYADQPDVVQDAYRVCLGGVLIGWVRKFLEPPRLSNGNRSHWQWQRALDDTDYYGCRDNFWRDGHGKANSVAAILGYNSGRPVPASWTAPELRRVSELARD